MVFFKHMGRLANYCYQMFAAYGYAIKHNLEFTVPTTSHDPVWHPVYFTELANQKFNPSLPSIVVPELKHGYHEIPYNDSWDNNMNIKLDGFFQSYLFWDFCIDDIRKMLPFNYDTIEGVCGIHVRRGDFLLYTEKHILPPPQYYRDALWLIHGQKKIKTIKLFSDDIAWCKENFKGDNIKFSEGKTELQDFEELMRCEAIVTAASSFSMLAGTLNANPDRLVVAPHEDNYWGPSDKHLDVTTMYPPDFYKISF